MPKPCRGRPDTHCKEPECKWALSASVHLGSLLREPVAEGLAALKSVDAMRATFYDSCALAASAGSAAPSADSSLVASGLHDLRLH